MSIRNWFRFRQERDDLELVKQDSGSQGYYVLLVASTMIATLGVLSDSVPTILAAMLIAPLMIPLMSLSVGISRGKSAIIFEALSHVSISILVVVALSFLVGKLLPVVDIPEQAIVRAQPSVIDLLVAIVAGAVGMYAYLHKDVPNSLAGVAIAVALVVPLTVVGLGFALGSYVLSLGATVLFFTNMVAITGAAVAVLFWSGRKAQSDEERGISLTGGMITAAVSIVLLILLSGSFVQVFREEQRKNITHSILESELEQYQGELEDLEVRLLGGQVNVQAIIQVPVGTELNIERLNAALVYALEQSVDLEVSLIETQRARRQVSTEEKMQIQQEKEDELPKEASESGKEIF